VTVSGVDSVEVRVHRYERSFPQNLSVVFSFDGNNSGIARDTRGSLGDVTDRARFCRTTATPIPGVSDPHGSRPGTGFGGWQRGSPHAPRCLRPDIHTQVAYTRSSGVHRGPHLYSYCGGLPGGR
jgi:hypothetical protein